MKHSPKYYLSDDEIRELTKPSPWRDFLSWDRGLSWEEYQIWWHKNNRSKLVDH